VCDLLMLSQRTPVFLDLIKNIHADIIFG
jgi:hypothetical protein